jgi:hypothetical protein
MLKTLENKSLTPEERVKKEADYERLIGEAQRNENHEEARRLKAQRRAMRGGQFPPEPVKAAKIYDARGKRDAPELVFDPAAPAPPMMCCTSVIVPPPSIRDRWKR